MVLPGARPLRLEMCGRIAVVAIETRDDERNSDSTSGTTSAATLNDCSHDCLNCAARSGLRSYTKMVLSDGNNDCKNRWISKLMRPQPRTATDEMSFDASTLAASAALAAVRFALMIEPSMNASGRPVRTQLRMIAAEARSRPDSRFAGKDETHLIPATSKSPPKYGGRGMIRFISLPGTRKKLECGSELCARS